MKVLIDKSFDKDIDKISRKNIRRDVAEIVEKLIASDSFFDIPNCSKMKGYKSAYRIRLGEYRIGISHENNTAVFLRILHRSKMYKNFP